MNYLHTCAPLFQAELKTENNICVFHHIKLYLELEKRRRMKQTEYESDTHMNLIVLPVCMLIFAGYAKLTRASVFG